MKLFIAILLIVADVAVAGPAQCYRCLEKDEASCAAKQQKQTCGGYSYANPPLGTTNCASAAIKYRESSNEVKYGFFRGCIDCADKKEACFFLGGYLKTSKLKTLLQCEIECCDDSNCNTQVPTVGLSQKGITVFTPEVVGPGQCQDCFNNDAASCAKYQGTQKCKDDRDSLGTTHCGSATIKYRDSSGDIRDRVISGCIDCADKKAACAAIGGYLKGNRNETLMECLIECCNGTNCNDKVPDPATCNECFAAKNADDCAENQVLRNCSGKSSIGKGHCASMAGKVLDFYGKTREIFFRGCIDCSDKKVACFALGGLYKGNDDTNGTMSLQKCAIECCKGRSCNNQVPTLTKDAINVFTQAASGPKQCNFCWEDDAAKCSNNNQTQVCAADLKSLGTTHCGSAVGKYREGNRPVREIFFRGCINCADKKVACATIGGFTGEMTQLECEIECCTGDNCNKKFPSKDGNPNKPAAQEGHRVLLSEKLAFATVLGVIVYLF